MVGVRGEDALRVRRGTGEVVGGDARRGAGREEVELAWRGRHCAVEAGQRAGVGVGVPRHGGALQQQLRLQGQLPRRGGEVGRGGDPIEGGLRCRVGQGDADRAGYGLRCRDDGLRIRQGELDVAGRLDL